jgi:hypothetical protein
MTLSPGDNATALARRAAQLLIAMQAEEGTATFVLRPILTELKHDIEKLLAGRDAIVRYDATIQDVAILALLENPPFPMPTAAEFIDPDLAIDWDQRNITLDTIGKLEMNPDTPQRVQNAATLVAVYLTGDDIALVREEHM